MGAKKSNAVGRGLRRSLPFDSWLIVLLFSQEVFGPDKAATLQTFWKEKGSVLSSTKPGKKFLQTL
jgi:hypothetical protein